MFNPLFWHLLDAQRDVRVRNVYCCGGAGAAKTYSIAQLLSNESLVDGFNAIVFRKESASVMKTVYRAFQSYQKKINEQNRLFENQLLRIKSTSGNVIDFGGVDDPEKAKGLDDYNALFLNELTKFDEEDFDEFRRRFRGRPNLKIYADWNRISEDHWTERAIISGEPWVDVPKEIEGNPYSRLDDISQKRMSVHVDPVTGEETISLLFVVTYRDNYWITGSPCGTYGFRDTATLANFDEMRVKKPRQYAVYGLGLAGTIRTGGEFWKSFDVDKHVGDVPYIDGKNIHLTVDINRLPYISQSLWQIDGGQFRQFDELCAATPDNTAVKAAQKVIAYLQRIDFDGVIYLYGDASGKNKTAHDNDSLFSIYIRELRKAYVVDDRIMRSNPSVALSAAFINEIYDGVTEFSIIIGDNCTMSKSDYNSVKEGQDGEMVKEKVKDATTGVTYEKSGHLSDAKRYFIVKVLEVEYRAFKARRHKYVIL